MAFKGRCLCGAVHYESTGPAVFAGNCYCTDCQRESGTGHITAVAVPDPTMQVTGKTVTFTKAADSGGTIMNTFCPVCGTTLFSHPSGTPGLALIRAGTLDDATEVKPHVNLYTSRAPAWDQPAVGLENHPEMVPPPPR